MVLAISEIDEPLRKLVRRDTVNITDCTKSDVITILVSVSVLSDLLVKESLQFPMSQVGTGSLSILSTKHTPI